LLGEMSDSRLEKLALSINRSALDLNNRISQFLDLAGIEVHTVVLNRKQLDTRQFLRDISNEMSQVASNSNLSFTLELPPSVPQIWADEDRIRQVILNLINNAFKYTSPGGKIILRTREKDDYLIVEIEDTGGGIRDEDQSTIFDPYQRKADDKERLSGLGLGLAISRSFVEFHGGQIWVDSKIG